MFVLFFCVISFPCFCSFRTTPDWSWTGLRTGAVFQYLMKAELLWLPIVGWKAVLARDIFVHRGTSTTFRQLLRSTTRTLKAGNSIMTFPGTALISNPSLVCGMFGLLLVICLVGFGVGALCFICLHFFCVDLRPRLESCSRLFHNKISR